MRVLVVEDNSTDRKVICRMVEGLGHEVVQTRHGLEALDALEQEEVDAVVLDLLMPLLNGLETMQQIRKGELSRRIPIIVLSGAEPELSRECLEAGASGYLSKPCSPAQLQARLRWACPPPATEQRHSIVSAPLTFS